jgi:hypothetical protein
VKFDALGMALPAGALAIIGRESARRQACGGVIIRERLMGDWKPCGTLGVHEHFIEIRCPVVVKRG